MKVNLLRPAATLACSAALAGTLLAQSSSPSPASPQDAARPGLQATQDLRSMDGQTVTLSGCLMAESSVPGQTPNPAERAGIAPDYILSNPHVRSAAPSGAAGAAAPGAPGATGTPGTTGAPGTTDTTGTTGAAAGAASGISGGTVRHGGTNVKLTSVDNDQMRQNLNRQVEVTGRLSMHTGAGGATGTTATTGTTAATGATGASGATGAMAGGRSLPELRVQSIRVLGESCTPK
jgi:hypothetical protein